MLSKRVILSFLPLILIVLLAVFARFIFLDKVPNAVGGDEIVYLLNAKASFISGHDIFGKWSPVQGLLFSYPEGETQAELPYILNSFVIGPLRANLFNAHLANAIMGILIIIVLYALINELFGRKQALFVAFLASINPWLVYIGRTAYEAIPATLFYLLAFYALLKLKGWKILLAFPVLILGFYSYIATKLILLPFLFVVLIYCYFYVYKKKYLKQYVVLFLLCAAFVFLYFVSLKLNPETSRLGEIFTPFNSAISSQVDAIRKTSIQTPFTNLFENKYTYYANYMIIKTFKIFSADYLFVRGDEFFSLWRHGLFYYIDALFIGLGALFMFIKKRNVFVLFSALILVGIAPHLLHSGTTGDFSIHSAMMYPFLIMFAGLGIYESINWFKKKYIKKILLVIVVATYIFSFANFLNIYLYWFPLRGYFDFPIRVVSSYALRASDNQRVTIYSTASFDYYKKYLFYINGYNKKTAKLIADNLNHKKYVLGNVSFVSCNSLNDLSNKNNLEITDTKCKDLEIDENRLSITRLNDGGESFKIYNDKLCSKYGLKPYPSGIKLSDFSIENLSNEDFCKTFITSY